MRRDASVTYSDIAREAGVSTATVSRVLSGGATVSGDRQRRVTDAAEALGYRTNRAARALRRSHSDTIGLVISDIEYPPIARLARVIETEVAKHQFGLMICNTDESLTRQSFYIDLLLQERAAGVIVMPATDNPQHIRTLIKSGVPTVTVDRVIAGENVDCVLIDNVAATNALIDDLVSHGRTRFLGIFGTEDATPSRERREAMDARLRDLPGVTLNVRTLELGSTIGTSQATRRLHTIIRESFGSLDRRPDAIVCSNAISIEIVMKELRHLHVRVPEEVAVVGYDDMTGLDLFYSPVTVADQPFEQIGKQAVELLRARMAGESGSTRQIIRIPPNMRFRASCGGRHLA